jgi:hypothetical protein
VNPEPLNLGNTLGFKSEDRVFKTARHQRGTLATDMGAFREVGKIVQRPAIFIQTIPASFTVESIRVKRLYRAGLYALSAFPAGFE